MGGVSAAELFKHVGHHGTPVDHHGTSVVVTDRMIHSTVSFERVAMLVAQRKRLLDEYHAILTPVERKIEIVRWQQARILADETTSPEWERRDWFEQRPFEILRLLSTGTAGTSMGVRVSDLVTEAAGSHVWALLCDCILRRLVVV